MGQPQLKTGFLLNLLNNTKRKILDDVTKEEAKNIVDAYLEQFPEHGLIIYAAFYMYFNEPLKAIELMNDCIERNGESYDYSYVLSIAYSHTGDMSNQLNYEINCLELNKKTMQSYDEKQSKHLMHLGNLKTGARAYLNDSENVTFAFRKFDFEEEYIDIMQLIEISRLDLSKMGVSLAVYQKFISIVHRVIYKHYSKGFSMALDLDTELDIAELAIYFDEISPQEAFELTNEIDDAILNATIDDDVFAKEVRKLTVNCTLREVKEEEDFA